MTVNTEKQTHGFQAQVKQLMHLVVHSLYSNKEIFLRELISNASDACDKLRFLALTQDSLYEGDSNLRITITFDEKSKTLTVADNGIGMNRAEIMENLGTIAKSGTREFLEKLSGDAAKDSSLIGQFGVGFYSAFIVADKVTVKSRKAGAPEQEGVRWESTGDGVYTIESYPKSTHGTEIILHIKEDETQFLSDWRLRSIITKYSDHISWPIQMQKMADVTADGETEKKSESLEFETINRATALWTRPKSEVTDEQYTELYRHIAHDSETPLDWSHNHVEGKQQYVTLLYIPARAPFDLWRPENKHGLKLFVKRVFIMDDAEQFLPRYLRFIKGIIDSSDLPLNVSREILQENQLVESIRKACVKRVLAMLEKMASDDKEKYAKFWAEFGLVLKEGPVEDFSNREQIAKLLRFSSTFDDNATPAVSFADYVSRMKPEQKKIYYITAESFNAAKSSPHLEIFRKKGFEVLLLSDRIDEWLVSHLSEFEGKHLQSITKGELDAAEIGADEHKEESEKMKQDFSGVIEQMKKVLDGRVKDVRITHRLTNSPACIVADSYDMGREMQRILQAAGQDIPQTKPIFEVNPDHALIKHLRAETDDDRFGAWTKLLFDQAVIAEGGQLDDPADFVKRMNELLLQNHHFA